MQKSLLMLTLTALVLTGCGGSSNDNQTGSTGNQSGNVATKPNVTPPTSAVNPGSSHSTGAMQQGSHHQVAAHSVGATQTHSATPIAPEETPSQSLPPVQSGENVSAPDTGSVNHPEPTSEPSAPEPSAPQVPPVPSKEPQAGEIPPVATLYPVITVQGNEFPTSQSILDGSLSQHSEEPVTAIWQQGKDKILGECELAGAKNTCHLELDRVHIDTKQPISLCLPSGYCTSVFLPRIKFTGALSYQDKVTAHLTGFSNNFETKWLLSTDPDPKTALEDDRPLQVNNQTLMVKLQNNGWAPMGYVNHYLFFCITDHGNGWEQQCFNVGEQAEPVHSFKELVMYRYDEKQDHLVGGGLYQIRDPKPDSTRSIAPVPYLTGHLNIHVYRPLTMAELYLTKTEIKDPLPLGYPLLRYYARYNGKDYKVEDHSGYYIVNGAEQLCKRIANEYGMPQLGDINSIRRYDWEQSGWPVGAYWNTSHQAYNFTTGTQSTPETAFTACKYE